MITPVFFTKITTFFAQIKNWVLEVFAPGEANEHPYPALRPKLLFCYSSILLLIKIAVISFVLILPYSNFFSAITQSQLISLINQARQNNSLPPVSLNQTLNETANLKVNDMLANNYFEHTSPSGATPWSWFKKAGYNYAYAGENLAIDFAQTDDVFSAWMASPAHRDNILNPNFTEIGLAVKNGPLKDHDATLAVLVFGKQQTVKASPPEAPKTNPKAQETAKTSKTPIAPTPKTPAQTLIAQAPASPSISVLPSSSPAPSALPNREELSPGGSDKENIELQSVAGETAESPERDNNRIGSSNNLSPATNKWTPKVLGAFASKSDEVTKSLYLYFTLFLTLALIVNIFIKIEAQYWQTTFATTLVILLSIVLIFI